MSTFQKPSSTSTAIVVVILSLILVFLSLNPYTLHLLRNLSNPVTMIALIVVVAGVLVYLLTRYQKPWKYLPILSVIALSVFGGVSALSLPDYIDECNPPLYATREASSIRTTNIYKPTGLTREVIGSKISSTITVRTEEVTEEEATKNQKILEECFPKSQVSLAG